MRIMTEILVGTLKERGFKINACYSYQQYDYLSIKSDTSYVLATMSIFDDSIGFSPEAPLAARQKFSLEDPNFNPKAFCGEIMSWLHRMDMKNKRKRGY